MSDHTAAMRENVIATYRALGLGMPGTVVQEHFFGTTVTGNPNLSFCQFAAGFDFDPRVTGTKWLTELSVRHGGIWAFCLPGDRPESIKDDLTAAGFTPRHSLTNMAIEGPGQIVEEVQPAQGTSQRRTAAAMMSELFFSSSSQLAKDTLAMATSNSICDIYTVGASSRPRAAMLLNSSPSAIGLYNLCVQPDCRRQGLGTSMVRHAQALACAHHKPLVLQCSADLVPWYTALGMAKVGTMKAMFGPSTP